jgi:menaquinone-9 beta-reductase
LRHDLDVIIVGAGPAGCAAAIGLCGSGLKVAMFDSSDFPRRKVCGGALSERTVNRLKEIYSPKGVFDRFISELDKIPSYGFKIFSPSLKSVDFVFGSTNDACAPGYVCERSKFDDFMLKEALSCPGTEFFPGTKIESVQISSDGVTAVCGKRTFTSKVIICSTGADPKLSGSLSGSKLKMQKDVGISTHFTNFKKFSEPKLIELYYLKESMPGYFWIFELPGDQANAGLYLPSKKVVSEKIDMKALFDYILKKYPVIGERFSGSQMTEPLKGSILPMITGRPDSNSGLCGDRYIITGDAAGLVDPMSGEGIGNALTSASFAAAAVKQAFIKDDFSASSLSLYTVLLDKKLGTELSTHRRIRNIFYANPAVLEFSLRTISGIKYFKNKISGRLYNKAK